MADVIKRAEALLSPHEVYKLREYSGHLSQSISTHLSSGKTFALERSLGKLNLHTGSQMDELLSRMTQMQRTLDTKFTAIQETLGALSDAHLGQARVSAETFVPRLRNSQGLFPPPEHFPLTWVALANLHEESVDALLRHYGLRAGRRQDRLERLTQFLQGIRD